MSILFSHPDRTLREHLDGLLDVTNMVLHQKEQGYWSFDELRDIMHLLISFHDIAKATPYFQFRIARVIKEAAPEFYVKNQQDVERWLEHNGVQDMPEEEIRKLSRHTLFGATTCQQRYVNEELSVDQLILFQVIRRHHGNLTDFNSSDFTEAFDEQLDAYFYKQFSELDFETYFKDAASSFNFSIPSLEELKNKFGRKRKIRALLTRLPSEKNIDYFLKTLFLYSLLLSADKGDVMLPFKSRVLKRSKISSQIIDNFKSKLAGGKKIDELREDAYQTVVKALNDNISKSFFEITLPTGLGKTFTAYKAALILKEAFANHRIIYCLPFTSIIDQNGGLLKEILRDNELSENLVTLHHYLSPPQSKNKDEDELQYQESEYLTEGWENEVIVTTFVQFFESIFTNKNRALRKLHNLANSIIILDEIQNVPPKYIESIEVVFSRMAEVFNTKFIFVTATQPIILPNKVVSLTKKEEELPSYYFDKMDRIYIDQTMLRAGSISTERFIEEVTNFWNENPSKSILVIVNTKSFSQEVFDSLTRTISARCLYLSASVIPFHRKQVIQQVKESTEPICLVSTQVVEAGVDIDFDVVYRELAPMDSINQAAGRCNRNGIRGHGLVRIFETEKKNNIYDSILMGLTAEVLKSRQPVFGESEIFNVNREYFEKVRDRVQKDNNKSRELLNYIYSLQFERIAENFKLIDKPYEEFNFFIEVNQTAKDVWLEYVNCFSIENSFERRARMKQLKPAVLEYVVSIPNYAIEVTDEEREQPIIRRENWSEFYDEQKGVIQSGRKHPNAFGFAAY